MGSNVLCSIENRFVGYSNYVFIIPITQGYNIEDNKTNILVLVTRVKLLMPKSGFRFGTFLVQGHKEKIINYQPLEFDVCIFFSFLF